MSLLTVAFLQKPTSAFADARLRALGETREAELFVTLPPTFPDDPTIPPGSPGSRGRASSRLSTATKALRSSP
jgi:hypothetical protein